jgi:hypothetical protein
MSFRQRVRAIIALGVACLVSDSTSAGKKGEDGLPVNAEMCNAMKAADVFHEGAPVDCSRLRTIGFPYFDFNGQIHRDGKIMVLDSVAGHVQAIFAALYRRRFPIDKANLMNHYRGKDDESMVDNNTSAFNDRPIAGGDNSKRSLHAYGLAIDLNPVQNPFVKIGDQGNTVFSPAKGADYANRLRIRPNKSVRPGMAEEVVDTFADNGFLNWGGYWDSPIDYQHFEVPRAVAECLASLPFGRSRRIFNAYVDNYHNCRKHHTSKNLELDRATCVAIGIRSINPCVKESP